MPSGSPISAFHQMTGVWANTHDCHTALTQPCPQLGIAVRLRVCELCNEQGQGAHEPTSEARSVAPVNMWPKVAASAGSHSISCTCLGMLHSGN